MRPLVALTFAAMISPCFTPAAAQSLPADFDAEALLVLSDGAMLASGYIDGRLGPRALDQLSVLVPGKATFESLAVSNSVALWPNILALTPDNRFAIITEPFAEPDENAKLFSEIERGQLLTVVDVSNPLAPEVIQRVEAPSSPAAVDVHPSGKVVAVTLPFEGQIALYPFEDGQLGAPTTMGLGIEGLEGGFVPEFKWRPDGQFAAVTLGGADRVLFFKYENGELVPWGGPMKTAPLPGMGRWTPDGRHFIVTTITATADMAQLAYGMNTSLFAVFAFDDTDTPDSPPRRADDRKPEYTSPGVQHARLGHIPGGIGYVESFAISPDGSLIAAANMRGSWLPEGHAGRTEGSEVSIFTLDQDLGYIEHSFTLELPGVILPQGITFDADSSHLAVTSFQGKDGEPGALHIFSIEKLPSDRYEIRPIGTPITLPRGAHFLKILK